MSLFTNPGLAIAGLTIIRRCHAEFAAIIPGPSVGKIALDPDLSGWSQFRLALAAPLEPDVPVTIGFTLEGNSNGGVQASVMGAATAFAGGNGPHSATITPTAETSYIEFRAQVMTDGKISGFSAELA